MPLVPLLMLAQAVAVQPAINSLPNNLSTLQGKDPNKVVCQLEEVQGSRIPERVCRTAAEWAMIAQGNDDAVEQFKKGLSDRSLPGVSNN